MERESKKMKPPEPLPTAGSSSRSAFPGAALGDHEAAVSHNPCVTLDDWRSETVEGDNQKIVVAGTFKRNQTLQEYSLAPIAKSHEPKVLETEGGNILHIYQVCKKFLHGFPDWWQRCKLLYHKRTNTHAECQPCSSNARNSGVDERGKHLISKFHDILGSFPHNDAVFQKSSHLLNGMPNFKEYTCDGDMSTNENAAASSEAATGNQKVSVVSLEVCGCRKVTQHMSLTEKAAVDDEMPTPVQTSFCVSNGTPILEEYTCNGDIPTNEDAAASNDDNERYTATSKEVNNMEIGHDDIATDVSLAPAVVEYTNNAVSESVQRTPATGTYRKKTPVASLKSQSSWRENRHIASNKKPVYRPQKQKSPEEKCPSATRFPVTRNSVSYAHCHWSPPTRGKDTSWSMTTVEALNLKRSRSGRVILPKLDEGCQSIAYGTDGSIVGVIGLESPAVPKWSGSKTRPRKRRKTLHYSGHRKLELT